MSRTKVISDAAILAIVCQRLLHAGEKAVSFREVASATGLSAPALVLRFGSQSGMVNAALLSAWAELEKATQAAAQDLGPNPKTVQDFLKRQADHIDIPALLAQSLRSPLARNAAAAWREKVEIMLADHFGGGLRARNTAGQIFAAWQGRLAWAPSGGKSFRFGEMLRALD